MGYVNITSIDYENKMVFPNPYYHQCCHHTSASWQKRHELKNNPTFENRSIFICMREHQAQCYEMNLLISCEIFRIFSRRLSDRLHKLARRGTRFVEIFMHVVVIRKQIRQPIDQR